MTLGDFIRVGLWDVMPVIAFICVVAGAALLWSRTRRASSLLQLIASVLLFLGVALNRVRWLLPPDANSIFADALRSEPMRIAMTLVPLLALIPFSISYLWYASTQERI